MSVNIGPKNPSSGLVLDIDMANTKKSWIGAPSTNLLYYSVALSNWVKSGGITSIVDNVAISPSGEMDASLVTANGTYNAYMYTTGNVTVSTYTRSVYAKAGSTGILVFESYDTPSGGVTTFDLINGVSTSNAGDTSSMITYPNGWYRCIVTRTFAASGGIGTFYIGQYGPAGTGTIYLWRPQLESGAVATPPVPTYGISASRAVTASVVDSTGYNTLTVNSLTYSNTGAFSFNGTSNSITVPFNASKFTFNTEQTIIMWIKPTSFATRKNPYNQAYGGGGTITIELDASINYYYGTSGIDGGTYTSIGAGINLLAYETVMLALTRTSSTLTFYKNGVVTSSGANAYGTVTTGTANINIGNGYAGYAAGSIYNLQLYNRGLSSDEILQVYNASRRRYLTNFVFNGLAMLLDANNKESYYGGTTWYDLSGNSKNGTISGATFTSSNGINSFSFNGSNNYVDCGANSITGSSAFTLYAWVKPVSVSSYSGAVSIGSTGNTFAAYLGSIQFQVLGTPTSEGGGFYGCDIGSGNTQLNIWMNIAFTYSGGANGTATFYINGVNKFSSVISFTPALTSTATRVGMIGTAGYYYNGSISAAAVYNRALSASEILQNYNATKEVHGL